MTVTLTFATGDPLSIPSVQTLRLAGPGTVDVQCFGNEAARHQHVTLVLVEPFAFPSTTHRTHDSYWCPECFAWRTHVMMTEELGVCAVCQSKNFAPMGENGP